MASPKPHGAVGAMAHLTSGILSTVLRTEKLGRKFSDRWIFRSLDIDLQQGQCLCVLGKNGSGKSTLLKVLAGLVSPTEGKVHRPDRNELGYAALDLALYPQLSAAEHLALFARFRGVSHPGDQALDNVGLGSTGSKPVGAFSTGMRARLKLVLATFYSPRVLMLDEPTAALDEVGQDLIAKTVQEQLARGALILATNSPLDRQHATHELELDD